MCFLLRNAFRWASTAENNCTLSIVSCGLRFRIMQVRGFRMAPTCRMLVEPSWPLVHPLFAFLGFLDVRKKVFWHVLTKVTLPWTVVSTLTVATAAFSKFELQRLHLLRLRAYPCLAHGSHRVYLERQHFLAKSQCLEIIENEGSNKYTNW